MYPTPVCASLPPFPPSQQPDEKKVLLIESGCRIHSTAFQWPKSAAPSGFAMKLRKHLNNKRLEAVEQLGQDRVVAFRDGMEGAGDSSGGKRTAMKR